MKMLKLALTVIFLMLLAACSSSEGFEAEVEKELYFQQGKKSNFAIRITEQGQPAEGLEIHAEFSMTNMDHGKYEAAFTEKDNGIYTSEVELPMAGEWEIIFTINHDGNSLEKVMEYEVKEAKGLAILNGEWITQEDVDFYKFINKLHIAISREQVKKQYKEEEVEDALDLLDEQEKSNQNVNTLLTQIIRLHSMALLGSEKGHTVSNEEVNKEIKAVREQYAQMKSAQTMIKEYGEERFWKKQESQYELIVLSQKVQSDLIEQVKKENPNVNEQEILYLAQKQYEELLVSQVNSMDIEIL